jgi:predicted nucleic acid-binding protein
MILADTSVWINHLRNSDPLLIQRPLSSQVFINDFVLGELALGSLRQRAAVLAELVGLPAAPVTSHSEVRYLIERHQLCSRGIGYTDAHVMASALLLPGLRVWTHDPRLAAVAASLGVGDWLWLAHALEE